MVRSKPTLLVLGVSMVILIGIGGTSAIDRHSFRSTAHKTDDTDDTDDVAVPHQSTITLQAAVQIAETAIGGKAYGLEREVEANQPVIEVNLAGKDVFVGIETGEIVAIEDLYRKGDSEDLAEVSAALKLQPYAIITIQEALQAAERFADGEIHTVELENKAGNLVYDVMIGLQKIYVDAGNGKVLYTELLGRSDDSDHRDRDRPDSSIQVSVEADAPDEPNEANGETP